MGSGAGCSRPRALPFAAWLVTVSLLHRDVGEVVVSNFLAATNTPSSTFSAVRTTATSDHLRLERSEGHWAPSPRHRLPDGVRIAFRVRGYARDGFRFRSDELCRDSAEDARRQRERAPDLPPTLTDVRSRLEWERGFPFDDRDGPGRGGRYLDFSTSVSTDLRVLFLGDSVAEQFGRAFDLAATVDTHLRPDATNPRRVVHDQFRVDGRPRACVFASFPVRGGGAVGMWRVVKLLSTARRDGRVCNSPAGGWTEEQLHKMQDQRYFVDVEAAAPTVNGTEPRTGETIGNFDAVVLRIPLGWMKPRDITEAALTETITLCRDYIGARTVVVMTINFTNDVHNPDEWAWAASTNDRLRDLARSFNRNETAREGGFRVQVMEFSNFTTQVHWANARTIRAPGGDDLEYPDVLPPNASEPHYELGAEFLFDRFQPWHVQDRHPQSIPTVCAAMLEKSFLASKIRRNCTRNAIMFDGLHWCMSSVGPRYHAGLSCLLGCAHNRERAEEEGTGINGDDLQTKIEQCERTCNEQFMSLLPIDEAWLEEDATMYSIVS